MPARAAMAKAISMSFHVNDLGMLDVRMERSASPAFVLLGPVAAKPRETYFNRFMWF